MSADALLNLSVTVHINCSVAHCLSHGMYVPLSGHDDVALFNDDSVSNNAELTQKIDHYVIFASLKSDSNW